jgi:S-(hydroxymethyl)glutathione dehydrogenase/alcohol dehydrogenase
MKAAVFHKPGDIRVDHVEDPQILHPQDIILQVTSTAICGSDLHIYNGFFPQVKDQVMGHEFMGVVAEKGRDVHNLSIGDRVIIPFPVACGTCYFCDHGLHTHCEVSNPENYGPEGDLLKGKGGGLFGYTDLYGGYAGGQAELVRVPYADYSAKKVVSDLYDEQVLFLTDIFPTGWAAVDWANLQGGETVVIYGSGPVGLMAQKAAWIKGAGRVIAVDVLDYRLEMGAKLNRVETLNPERDDVVSFIRSTTAGRGADVCIDAVGMEAHRDVLDKIKSTINLEKGTDKVLLSCMETVRRGGMITVVGVYGSTYDNFPVHKLFDKGLSIRMGQVPVQRYMDELYGLVESGRVELADILTHKMPLDQASHAYDIFKKKEDDCVKVILKP